MRILAGNDKFDVILWSADSDTFPLQSSLSLLMAHLKPEGTLIARIRVSPTEHDEATIEAEKLFSGYVYKGMGESNLKYRDGAPLQIFHVKNRVPFAVLLMGSSGSGKSTVAKFLFPGLHVIHGDEVMRELADLEPGTLDNAYNYLSRLCLGPENGMTVGGIMIEIFNSAAGKEYACLVAELASHRDFVYDGVIHENFRHVFVGQLKALGYQVLTLDTPNPAHSPNDLFKQAANESRKYQLFLAARKAELTNKD